MTLEDIIREINYHNFPRCLIPQQFHRTLEEQPFDSCDSCYQSLFEPPKPYIIIKQYLDQQLQQEMVICLDCRQDLHQSLAKIPMAIKDKETQEKCCLFCSLDWQAVSQYVEYCYCEGQEMVNYFYPFLVCGTCLKEIYQDLAPEAQELRKEFYLRRFLFPSLPNLENKRIDQMIFELL